MKRKAHLVGSVGLRDAETVFTTVSEILGPCCPRFPDGETGERGYWIRWHRDTFSCHPDFELAITTRSLPGYKDKLERTFFKLKDCVGPTKLKFCGIGYGREALKSYRKFARLAEEGKVASDTRFQVSPPTPMALLCGFVIADDRLTTIDYLSRCCRDRRRLLYLHSARIAKIGGVEAKSKRFPRIPISWCTMKTPIRTPSRRAAAVIARPSRFTRGLQS